MVADKTEPEFGVKAPETSFIEPLRLKRNQAPDSRRGTAGESSVQELKPDDPTLSENVWLSINTILKPLIKHVL